MNEDFLAHLTDDQRVLLADLSSPARIQAFLDSIPYEPEYFNRCPARVLRDRQGHCLDGALFAAAALRQLGDPPLIIDLLPEPGTDDDHVLAIYRRHGYYGAIAKSNFVGLRFREAVYRTLRELAMSYFEVFFNVHGVKTLRAYTTPLDLRAFDASGWMWNDAAIDAIEQRLERLRRVTLITAEQAAQLSPLDERSYQAGLLGADPDGLYDPQKPM